MVGKKFWSTTSFSDDRTEGALSATLWRSLPAQVGGEEEVGERSYG